MPLLPLTDDELAMVEGAGPVEELVAQVQSWITHGHNKVREAVQA